MCVCVCVCRVMVAAVLGKGLLGGSWKVRRAIRRRQYTGVPRAGAGAGAGSWLLASSFQLLAFSTRSHSSRSASAHSRDLMRAQGLRLSLEKG